MEEKRSVEVVYFIPIVLLLAFVPLIVVGKRLTISGLELLNWTGGESHVDFFSYYKSLSFIIIVFSSFILLFIQQLFRRINIKASWIYLPLVIYCAMVFVSTNYSVDFVVSWRGFIEQFQGVWVLIGYALAIVIAYNMVNTDRDIKIVLFSLLFSGLVIFVIGFTQYFGFSILENEFIQNIILPASIKIPGTALKFNNTINTISATMYNSNFVGSYAAILFPITITLFIFQKKKFPKLIMGIITSMAFFIWIGSKSRAGYIGIIFAFIIFLIIMRKEIRKRIKSLIALFSVFAIIILFMNYYSAGSVMSEFDRLGFGNEAQNLNTDVRFNDLKFDGNNLDIITSNETFKISTDGTNIKFMDSDNNELKLVQDGEFYIFDNIGYENYKVQIVDDKSFFKVFAYEKELIIFITAEGLRLYDIGATLGVTEYPMQFTMLQGKEKLFSGRGFIWMDSIPLLEGALIYGYGPGTYPIVFPQQDYVGKLNFSMARIVVDKAHDMYLQIGIENGVVALVALLIVFLIYLIRSLKVYWRCKFEHFRDFVGVGIFLGVIGYLVAGIFNDQVISVAPIFYVLLGTGLSLNESINIFYRNIDTQKELDIINSYTNINEDELTDC